MANSPFIYGPNGAIDLVPGGITLPGATSGSLQIQPAAATTTYQVTMPPAQGAANQSLVNNGSGILSWSPAGGGSIAPTVTQLTGSGTYTTPAGAIYLDVQIVGGGGGGGGIGAGSALAGTGGGGAGGYSRSFITGPSSTYLFSVGISGIAGTGSSGGGTGGTTTFGTSFMTALGGVGGADNIGSGSAGSGGLGGSASGGNYENSNGGGGGSGSLGVSGVNFGSSGGGGASFFGGGGAALGTANSPGNPGLAPGSGGGGAAGASMSGGIGAVGTIIVTAYFANGSIGTATNVTGIVAQANGGTGVTTAQALAVTLNTTTSATANTNILWDSVMFNSGSGTYSASTGAYTVQTAGIYLVNSTILLNATTTLLVVKNGTQLARVGQSTAASVSAAGSYLVQCVVGDTLSVQSGATGSFVAGATGSFMNIHLIH